MLQQLDNEISLNFKDQPGRESETNEQQENDLSDSTLSDIQSFNFGNSDSKNADQDHQSTVLEQGRQPNTVPESNLSSVSSAQHSPQFTFSDPSNQVQPPSLNSNGFNTPNQFLICSTSTSGSALTSVGE